ncbi:K(+)-transporting ATPase subunit F [Kamptonema animale CS-326]|jgi:K+-transporting ATPase KdpF subunit|uniref:K(+)-transporting ATPase subunit F n=1 Tax=Kamptonema animale TaxID=92934 RepID=UPI00232AFFFE|nr:K(+)-transporting ATPase subunit F [Kamptonema animale]MDB9512369.1 K(+)-transporting ATPase subunit F [Kamptonema animale CS-326]
MKGNDVLNEILPSNFKEVVELWQMLHRRHPVTLQLFLLMCLNLVIAPAVYAATGEEITRKAAWAIGILGLVTLGLSVYLFVVIFQPERF